MAAANVVIMMSSVKASPCTDCVHSEIPYEILLGLSLAVLWVLVLMVIVVFVKGARSASENLEDKRE